MEGYRFEARSIEGFVQQLATGYLARGYVFYVAGSVPEGKEPREVDEKLLSKYAIGKSRWSLRRARKRGGASVQYLRFGRFFLLLATPGLHRLFEEERVRDVRREPIRFAGYSMGIRRGCVRVRIDGLEYRFLKRRLLVLAGSESRESLEEEFRRIPLEPWKAVRAQLLAIFRAVNRVRERRGLEALSRECVRWKRTVRRVFEMG